MTVGAVQSSGAGSNTDSPTPAFYPRRSTLPIVPHGSASIDTRSRKALRRVADALNESDPRLSSTEAFGPRVSSGLGPWPSIFIEDHSGIRPYQPSEDVTFSYRVLLLAGEGDVLALGVPRNSAFEGYCRDLLDLGAVPILEPRPSRKPQSLAKRCAEDTEFVECVASRARSAGGLNVIPYMGTGGIWSLACKIADAAGVAIKVAAPPPRLTAKVNDKLWFAARAQESLGAQAIPPAKAVYSLSALTVTLRALAKNHACVAVKLTDSASSVGNIVVAAADLVDHRSIDIRDTLVASLQRAGWQGRFPVMVTAWEQPVLESPSVQVWIPDLEAGEPMVEGIFDQTLIEPRGRFSGATPTRLPSAIQDRLREGASKLAWVLQHVGYFGRCSFDAILVGSEMESARIHWVECNGRWGGVSIPMTLANRLVGDWQERPFVVVDRSGSESRPRSFNAVLDLLGDDLFVAGRKPLGAVLISPGQIETGTGFEIMVIGESIPDAITRAGVVAARLLR